MNAAIGISFHAGNTGLVARARALLAHGPVDSVRLVAHVCRMPAVPTALARTLATTLLGADADFVRDRKGRWMLARQPRGSGRDVEDRTRLRDLDYVVVDVETTGTSCNTGDRITEVAAVRVRGGEIVDVFETLVNPERSIPAFISELTRITWSMVRDAPRFPDIAAPLSEALAGHLFVAHNANFDWRFVTSEFARATGAGLHGERLCTVRFARAVLPGLKRRSLDALAHYFGVEISARHRAGGDALATAKVLLRLIDAAEARGYETLAELREAMRARGRRAASRRRGYRSMPRWSDGFTETA